VKRNESEIPVRVPAAQSVMDMANRKLPAMLRSGGRRAAKKRHRIGSAGDGEQDRGARRHPPGQSRILERARDEVHRFMVTPGLLLQTFFRGCTNLAPR
jgi:hypothetical protein